jgi:hypothetical protein
MRKRGILWVSVSAIAAIVAVVFLRRASTDMSLKIEYVGLTNIPTTGSSNDWMAYNAKGKISSLPAVSPSHARFKVSNNTRQTVDYRFLLYDFADADTSVPDIGVHDGMRFGPAWSDVFNLQVLKPGETKVVILPRPPFECVWRANVAYLLPMAATQDLLRSIGNRMGRKNLERIGSDSKGRAVYDKMLPSVWITNTLE